MLTLLASFCTGFDASRAASRCLRAAAGGTKKWDTCAPEALLLAVGGCLTDVRGVAYDYSHTPHPNSNGLVASVTAFDTYVAALRDLPPLNAARY